MVDAATDDASVGPASCDEAAASHALAGCRFIQVIHNHYAPPYPQRIAGCFALLVANPSKAPVALRLRHDDLEADAANYARVVEVDDEGITYHELSGGLLPPRSIALISTLHIVIPPPSQGPITGECPSGAFIEATLDSDAVSTIGQRSRGIELLADAPVLATSVLEYQWQMLRDQMEPGELWPPHQLVPVDLWDAETMDTGKFKPGGPRSYENPDLDMGDGTHWELDEYFFHGRTSLVACEPGTSVSFPQLDGTTTAITLDRGEVYTYLSEDAFIGRLFAADKPISVISAMASYTPWDYPFGFEPESGAAISVAMPSGTWGSEYVAVRHSDRWGDVVEDPPWRIIGGTDGTILSYEPYHPAGAPDKINRGELVIFEAGAPFVVRSQDASHSFFLGGHMTGGRYLLQRNGRYPNSASRGGGVSIAEVPVSRWGKRYPFFAMLEWPDQNLVVVRRHGGADVTLDCAGVLTGWQPVGSDYEYAYVPLIGPHYVPVSYGSVVCNAGPHWIESKEPFRATLWGWSSASMEIEFFPDGSSTTHQSAAYAVPLQGYDAPSASID